MEFLRADDEVDVPQVARQLRAAALRHAAEQAENHLRLVLAEPAEHPHFAERLLLRHVAHRAGIEQHHIGLRLARRPFVATRQEVAQHLLGVALIHLAAISFDVDLRHGGAKTVAQFARSAMLHLRDPVGFYLQMNALSSDRDRWR